MTSRTDDNRERDRENLKEMMAKIRSDMDAIRAETKVIHERRMGNLDVHHERMMAHQEATKTEPDPGLMQSTEEHREFHKEEAAVMQVGELRKRRRFCSRAAKRRQKRKERILGNRGSRRKSAAACRKLTRRVKVAWRKRNHFRNVQTQRNCGPRKRLTVTSSRKMTSDATWHGAVKMSSGRTGPEPGKTRNPETMKRQVKTVKGPESSNGTRSRGVYE
jgi:hypothetical protein